MSVFVTIDDILVRAGACPGGVRQWMEERGDYRIIVPLDELLSDSEAREWANKAIGYDGYGYGSGDGDGYGSGDGYGYGYGYGSGDGDGYGSGYGWSLK